MHDAARAAGVPLLVDAGASLGHVDVGDAWDLLAADAGDWGGPGGLGVLVTRSGVRRSPDWPEDEDRWFPGGVSVPAALAAAVALQVAVSTQARRTTPRAAGSSTRCARASRPRSRTSTWSGTRWTGSPTS